MAAAGSRLRVPRRWGSFAAGISVGLATGLVGVGLAVAWERARRAQRQDAALSDSPAMQPAKRTGASLRQSELDEELADTFPASDPLPHSHRVD